MKLGPVACSGGGEFFVFNISGQDAHQAEPLPLCVCLAPLPSSNKLHITVIATHDQRQRL